ncbi:DUF1993 domain-containing protein [Chondromyces apiculatus]|uniref:DUF1993 domain-containing protein n=1 Tax=Chondromyces apiculatus DSM 436 TaxID=1192034 RepID=A0A017TEG9_9BACT|nr:DUF1993 domain-containing protein [Chondromyces apiculatus]EYF07220.1 Hypothetical protein CAP_0699 [Chondromyces apiculatus DSM 436]
MSLSMHELSIPIFIQGLEGLASVLKKGVAHAESQNIDPAKLTQARLAPDMHPLTRQVQIASDGAKKCVARLADIEAPVFPDTEETFPELLERIQKTIDFLRSVDGSKLEGSETREIKLPFPNGTSLEFTGKNYLLTFATPNFYFHVTTAYDILRNSGVPLTKADFLGASR